MDYFSILNLNREPFSNSPDPDYFYHSRQHLDCLQKLELSLHLRRGLNVIIGEVGTGKTTLCRQLIRRFAQRKEIETHLILDPLFKNSGDFLATVVKLLSGKKMPEGTTDWQAKEFIKHSLFRKGVDQKKTTVLIIDEGQKTPAFCLELLREFLNYETNEYKLLQIVIFAQKEFEAVIRRHPNFGDRINLYHHLKPLSFRDSCMMIRYRLEKSSTTPQKLDLFTLPALLSIYQATAGYPRKIINLCHQCILAMIIQNKSKVGYLLSRRCATRVFTPDRPGRRPVWTALAAAGALAAVVLWAGASGRLPLPSLQWDALLPRRETPAPQTSKAPPVAEAPAPAVPPAAPAEPAPTVAAAALAAPGDPPAAAPEPAPTELPPPAAVPIQPAEAPPTPVPEASAPRASVESPRPPEMLGTLNLRRNETISGLIQKVYGNYSNKNFRAIILANPHIVDPDLVEVGRPIRLPAVPAALKPLNKNVWWVKIAEAGSLQEGFDLLRTYPESAPPARLIPSWHPVIGLRFAVILKQLFSNPDAARLQLNLLPPSLSAAGEVLDSWGEQTVLYADPYYVSK
jgi:general secretion pathway protein A